jgi:hypothetical protein
MIHGFEAHPPLFPQKNIKDIEAGRVRELARKITSGDRQYGKCKYNPLANSLKLLEGGRFDNTVFCQNSMPEFANQRESLC